MLTIDARDSSEVLSPLGLSGPEQAMIYGLVAITLAGVLVALRVVQCDPKAPTSWVVLAVAVLLGPAGALATLLGVALFPSLVRRPAS